MCKLAAILVEQNEKRIKKIIEFNVEPIETN